MIETPEKYWLRWKEARAHPAADDPLLRELGQPCGQERLLEIMPRRHAHRDALNRAPFAHEEWTY